MAQKKKPEETETIKVIEQINEVAGAIEKFSSYLDAL